MKTLTILQPWASLIALGAKRIETRSWRTDYRGPLAIHASQKFPMYARNLCTWEPVFMDTLADAGITDPDQLPLGAVIAVCRLVGCRKITPDFPEPPAPEGCFGDYRLGRYAWFLKDVRMLPEPIPAKGRLGLWDWEPPEGVL